MNKFLLLLQKHTTIRYLLTIQLICDFAVWFVHMAIYALLIELDAPVWAITLAAALSFFSGVVFAPFSGTIVDRVPTKPMLLFILVVEILTAIVLIFIDSLSLLWLLFVILFIRMSFATLYFQGVMALFPKLLSKHELKTANELNSLIWSICYTSGMAAAGVFVHFFGVDMAIISNILLYIIALFILIKTKIPNMITKTSRKFLLSLKEGIIYIKRKPLLIHLMMLHAAVGLTAYDALVALLAKFNYPTILSAPLVIGLIDVSRAIALSVGTFTLSKFINEKNLFVFFILQGVGILLWALFQFNFYTGLFGAFMAGICTALLWSFTYTLIQNNTSKKFYGRVIAYNDMIFLTTATFTSFAIGFLFELGLSLNLITALIGFGFFGFGFYYLWIQKRFLRV